MTIDVALTVAGFVLAAGAGAGIRFLVGRQLNGEFPLGTLVVNLVASAALGVIAAAEDPLPVILGVGALGALSTWSTAANEAAEMARDDNGRLGLAYLGLTVSSGVLAAWFGLKIGAALLS
jgi:CrcB protein